MVVVVVPIVVVVAVGGGGGGGGGGGAEVAAACLATGRAAERLFGHLLKQPLGHCLLLFKKQNASNVSY